MDETLEISTADSDEALRSDTPDWIPALTIACHPDLRRVGARALLTDIVGHGRASVSRAAPSFRAHASHDGPMAGPLGDPSVSRSPLTFARDDDGVRVAPGKTRVELDGQRLTDPVRLSLDRLRHGVPLLLGRRVALVLCAVEPPGRRAAPLGLVGHNQGMERLRHSILRVADVTIPVLIQGETGVGKELVARAIHDFGPRRGKPFVSVNVGGITPTLAASTLFGHVRGAFTGASTSRTGLYGSAEGGTLFLDEVGEMPSEVQVMLLRALETSEYSRLGSDRLEHADVRIVAATDRDLERAGALGDFRLPLLHRLSGYVLRVPPLRERRDDIGELLVHFLRDELAAVGELDRLSTRDAKRPWLPAPVVMRLLHYSWPGNVRQLRNVARQLVIASRGSATVRVEEHLSRMLDADAAAAGRDGRSAADATPRSSGETADIANIVAAMRRHDFQVGPTARALGVSKPTLYRLIDESEVLRLVKDIPDAEIAAAFDAHGGNVGAVSEGLMVSRRALTTRLKKMMLLPSQG